jgi:hypothetical protein
VEFLLDNSLRRVLLIGTCAIVAAIFCYEAVRVELATKWIASGDLGQMQRAVSIEPGDADNWDQLGRFVQFTLDTEDLRGALRDYEAAVRISPETARYWVDLAVVHENLGNSKEARDDFAEALKVYPASAEVHWEYGNFLLRQDQLAAAMSEMHVAVMGDRSLLPLAVTRAWRSTQDAEAIATQLLPAESSAYIETLNFFATENLDAGLEIWHRLAQLPVHFSIDKLFPFLDELIREERSADAVRMWLEGLAKCGLPHRSLPDQSVVWNGGFEQDMLNGGFDWRMESSPGMTWDYDTSVFQGGRRSIRLDFTGGINIDLNTPYIYVPVEPDRTYHFEGFMRTDGITTDSGPQFDVSDPFNPYVANIRTEELVGTQPWTALTGDIHTGPRTHILKIMLKRWESGYFDNKLGGSVWIDDVSLAPADVTADSQTSNTRPTR